MNFIRNQDFMSSRSGLLRGACMPSLDLKNDSTLGFFTVWGGKAVSFSFVGDPVCTNCAAQYPAANPGRVEITNVLNTSVKSTDGTSKSMPHTSGSVKCTLNVQGVAFVVTIHFQVSMNAFMGRVYWNNKELSADFTNLKTDLKKDSPDILKAFGGSLKVSAAQNMFANYEGLVGDDGKITKTSEAGLVTQADFAGLFATAFSEKQGVVKSEIKSFITSDDAGKLISNATIEADKINLNGHTLAFKSNQITIDATNFKLDASGNVSMTGKINATSGTIGGFAINESSIGSADLGNSIKGMYLSKNQVIFNTKYGQGVFGSFFMTGGYCYGSRITLDSGDSQNNAGIYIDVNCRSTIFNNRGLDIIATGGMTSLSETDNYGNHAIWAQKGCYAGFRPKITLANADRVLTEMECFISCQNSSGITLTLPSSPQLGQYYKILRFGNGNVTVKSNSSNIRYATLNYISSGYNSDAWSTSNSITASYKNMTIELIFNGTYWCANYYRQMVK